MSLTFYIVDVFAEEKYAGNQLAVVLGAADLPDETLRKIALEMNYSETSFVLSGEEIGGGFDVRIFTPGGEVPFAGHPTLGTAYVIQREILAEPVDRMTLKLKAGEIPVTFGEVLWMRQLAPTFGSVLDPASVAGTLGLEGADLDDRYPVQEVSTGLPALIVPLENLDALQRCRVHHDRYLDLVENIETNNILVFSPEPHESADLAARMFAPGLGVTEDPATGSANGCLAAYLLQHRYFGTESIDIRIEQGYEIDRPSLLYLQAQKRGGQTSVHVGGKVQLVARGELI